MKFYTSPILLCFLLLMIQSCKESSTEKNNEQAEESSIIIETKDLKAVPGFTIKSVKADTLLKSYKTSGINLEIQCEYGQAGVDEMNRQNFGGAYINCKSSTTDGKIYETRSKLISKSEALRVAANKDQFFMHPTSRKIIVHIPWRDMDLTPGAQELDIFLEWKGVQYSDDSSASEYRMLKYISDPSMSVTKVKVKIQAPELYSVAFEVSNFSLNTDVVDPSKFDFALGGSGYPDLYWKLYCGDEILYYSDHVKNKLNYEATTSSPVVKCTAQDVFRFCISDYDNGPFNTDDIIESWYGKIADLPADSSKLLPLKDIRTFRVKRK